MKALVTQTTRHDPEIEFSKSSEGSEVLETIVN